MAERRDIISDLITERGGTLFLRVRVSPGSSREGVFGIHGDALRVAVRAPPERGKANRAVLACLAGALGLRRSELRVAAGETSRDKSLEVAGVSRSELEDRLRGVLERAGTRP